MPNVVAEPATVAARNFLRVNLLIDTPPFSASHHSTHPTSPPPSRTLRAGDFWRPPAGGGKGGRGARGPRPPRPGALGLPNIPSARVAATPAPTPPVATASCTIRSRPVRRTEPSTI